MKFTLRIISIISFFVVFCAAASAATFARLPKSESAAALFDAIVNFSSVIIGAAVAVTIFYAEIRKQQMEAEAQAEAERARLEAEEAAAKEKTRRRVQWALRRLSVEIIDAVEATESLMEDSSHWNFTNLADDVWTTSRKMLAEEMPCGPMHYALTDFYKRLRVLQKADAKRLDHLLRKGDNAQAEAQIIIQKPAKLVLAAGQVTLDLLRDKGEDVAQRIEDRITVGPNFAQLAQAESREQAKREAA